MIPLDKVFTGNFFFQFDNAFYLQPYNGKFQFSKYLKKLAIQEVYLKRPKFIKAIVLFLSS